MCLKDVGARTVSAAHPSNPCRKIRGLMHFSNTVEMVKKGPSLIILSNSTPVSFAVDSRREADRVLGATIMAT